MDSAQGFAAQSSGAAVILAASQVGYPLSTTHTISGAVMGAGAAKRVSAVRWGVAGNIVVAWILTLPASACIGAAVYGATRLFGEHSEAGPVVVAALILAACAAVFVRRVRRGSPITAAEVR
jgi:inorganic phosphate transporter, PiT family